MLVRLAEGPAFPAELADLLGAGRANVSNHLACLRDCGLVAASREGRNVRYRLAHPDLAEALRLLGNIALSCTPDHADLDGRA
jgi:DNA-binding transcriptional ArsR family regulator